MLTDDELDTRLRAAGERFRASSAEPAAVVIPRPRRRVSRQWVATLASAAAVAAIVVGVMQLTSKPHPAQPAVGSSNSIAGVHWRLAGVRDAVGGSVAVTRPVELFVDVTAGSGTITASDGCNAIGGPARLVGDHDLVLGDLISTTMACPGLGEQQQVIDKVLTGTVSYRIDGGTLTLTRAGAGSLTYTAAPSGPTAAADPNALVGPKWQLTGIGEKSGDTVSMRVPSTRAVLSFDGTGHYTLTQQCGSFHGEVTIAGAGMRLRNPQFVPSQPCGTAAQPHQGDVQDALSRVTTWTLDADGAELTLTAHDTTLQFHR